MRQILFRTLWHTRRQRPLLNTRLQICFVTQLHTLLQTHSSFFCTWRFSPSNHKKIQLVYNWRLVYLSWVLVVCRTLRGFIIPPTLTPGHLNFWRLVRSHSRLSGPKFVQMPHSSKCFWRIFFVINECCRIKQSHSLVFGCCFWVIRLYESNCAVKLFVPNHLLLHVKN